MKEYKIISDKWIEPLIEVLNKEAKEGWEVIYMLQEHAYTKIILGKDKNG